MLRERSTLIVKKMQKTYRTDVKENIELYSLMLPVLVHIIIFCYIPLYGIVIAFQNYVPGSPFIAFDGSVEWVGLKHFADFIKSPYFSRIIRNTITLSSLKLVFGFWVPIAFALILNELTDNFYKKFVQTASYMPHFISSVVVAGIVLSFLSTDGLLNQIVVKLGGEARSWNIEPKYFPFIYTITIIWKTFGWNSILYLSTITSIDPALYESAKIDGANRFHQMKHITLPSILPLMLINLIFAVGSLLGSNTEMILLLYNPAVYETADVIGTYVYRDGLMGGNFSSGTASGLFVSTLNFILLFIANSISKKITDFGLW
jgi:putative aldouronate transport system permease protein